jgi:hypothetical protein
MASKFFSFRLELEEVRNIVSRKAEASVEVEVELGGLLDGLQESGVHALLIGNSLSVHGLLGLDESSRLLLLLLVTLLWGGGNSLLLLGSTGLLVRGGGLLEVSIVELSVDLNSRDVHLGGGGNDVTLVDAAERDTVDLEGTWMVQKQRVGKREKMERSINTISYGIGHIAG